MYNAQEEMRAATLAARTFSYYGLVFRPECRQCPTGYDKIAIDSIITHVEREGRGFSIKTKRERMTMHG